MTTILLVVQFVLAVIVTIVVLLQKSSSIGLGAYSGSNESVFGAKGPTGFLQKATMTLGLLFVINTIALGYIYNKENYSTVMDSYNANKIVPDAPKANQNTQDSVAPEAPILPPSAPSLPEKNK